MFRPITGLVTPWRRGAAPAQGGRRARLGAVVRRGPGGEHENGDAQPQAGEQPLAVQTWRGVITAGGDTLEAAARRPHKAGTAPGSGQRSGEGRVATWDCRGAASCWAARL